MSSKRGEPMVPLSVAEMLYVTLATAQQSTQLDERTRENLGLILAGYRVRRDVAIKNQGYDDVDVNHYAAAAAEALANWLDDRATQAEKSEEDEDLAFFEGQFDEREAQDQDQGTNSRGEPKGEGDDRTRGTHYEAPESSQRAIGGGSSYPGEPKPDAE